MKKAGLNQKIKEIAATKQFRIVLTSVLCTLALLIVFRLFLLVFPVRHFEVEGETQYDISEIVNAARIRKGDRLYWLNASKAENNVLRECKYLKSIKIKRVFPNKIVFEVEERAEGWYIQVGDDFYALDYDLKVLFETYKEENLIERGLTKLILPNLESVYVGELPSFGEGDEHLISETLKIIDNIRTHKLKERLSLLDLSNRFEIKLTVDGSYNVEFGDMTDYKTKFDMIEKIVDKSSYDGYVGGEINVINPTAHVFKGYYPEENDEKEKNN